jgi:hypothetical protein
MERLNEEVRRRERVIRIFPNCESTMRLLGAHIPHGRLVHFLDLSGYRETKPTSTDERLPCRRS